MRRGNCSTRILGAAALLALCGIGSCGRAKPVALADGSFAAYSLAAAERQLGASPGEAITVDLGGITRLAGMVYDAANQDLILVGQIQRGEPKITLDDLVVALRARLVEHAWPLVSIDRTPETRTTGEQQVRMDGGIARTQFGRDLIEADVALKRMALGLLPTDPWGGRSYAAMSAERVQRIGQEESIGSRFWFYPVSPALVAREGVFAIANLKLGVLTEVLSVGGRPVGQGVAARDEVGDAFATSMTERYREVSATYPEVQKLWRLFSLVAIARGVETLSDRPNLDYWLNDYHVATVETPERYPLLRHHQRIAAGGHNLVLDIDGGVELRALVLRLRDGDVTALKELVLRSRPSREALVWPVPLEGWSIPGAPVASSPPAAATSSGGGGCYVMRRSYAEGKALPTSGAVDLPGLGRGLPQFSVGNGLLTAQPASTGDRGGVTVAPEPTKAGRGGTEARRQTLKSRPAKDSISWPVALPASKR